MNLRIALALCLPVAQALAQAPADSAPAPYPPAYSAEPSPRYALPARGEYPPPADAVPYPVPAAPDGGYPPPPDVDAPPDTAYDVSAVPVMDDEPPVGQPAPMGAPWVPPPMLVESPGEPPWDGAYWTGGYWYWGGQWIWARGHWRMAPYAGYFWQPPYYELRAGWVVFIPGFWCAPGVVFIAPPPALVVAMVPARPGVPRGPRAGGPLGVFVPPPPGSRAGLVVPAPVGTHPAVVIGAPPIIRIGMQIRLGEGGQLRVDAPAAAFADGHDFHGQAPRAAHLAAAQVPVQARWAPGARPAEGFPARRGPAAPEVPREPAAPPAVVRERTPPAQPAWQAGQGRVTERSPEHLPGRPAERPVAAPATLRAPVAARAPVTPQAPAAPPPAPPVPPAHPAAEPARAVQEGGRARAAEAPPAAPRRAEHERGGRE